MEAAAVGQQLGGHGAWRDRASGVPRTVTGSALFRKSGQHLPRLSVHLNQGQHAPLQRRLGQGLAASQAQAQAQGLAGVLRSNSPNSDSQWEAGSEGDRQQQPRLLQAENGAAASSPDSHNSHSDSDSGPRRGNSPSQEDPEQARNSTSGTGASTSSSSPSSRMGRRSSMRPRSVLQRSRTLVRKPAAPARVAELWKEVQGSRDWEGLLEPLHPAMRSELVRYGEFAQACYDAFDGDTTSRYCGSCKFDQDKMLESVGLPSTGYRVTKYIYATSQDLQLMPAFFRSPDVREDAWSRDSNWVGFVAVCTAEGEIARLGRRDILVAWRGTVTSLEWKENMRDYLVPMQPSPGSAGGSTHLSSTHASPRQRVALKAAGSQVVAKVDLDVKVEKGFYRMYSSSNADSRYNKSSAKEQALAEVRRLVEAYGHEELSISVTGHSLGGALAVLCAYDVAAAGVNRYAYRPAGADGEGGDDALHIPVTVFNFAAPRVGNEAFRQRLEQELRVKVLRVVNERDTVPRLPGFFTNEKLPMLCAFLDWLPWTYSHVGVELRLSSSASTCLDHAKSDMLTHHSMDLYLHLLDAFKSRLEPFGNFCLETSRDVALLNKYCDILDKRFRVPPCWWQEQHKGLVYDKFAQRWRQRDRDPDDIPVNIDRSASRHRRHE